MVIVYTMEHCPNCEQLKGELARRKISFETRPMDSAESITEMRVNGCFAMEAPVIQVGEEFYEYRQRDEFFNSLHTN